MLPVSLMRTTNGGAPMVTTDDGCDMPTTTNDLDAYYRVKRMLERRLPTLSHRQRVAFAATCTERMWEAVGPTWPDYEGFAEVALELAWAFSFGEHVSHDELQACVFDLEEAFDEVYSDLNGVEKCVTRAVLFAARAIEEVSSIENARHAGLELADAVDYLLPDSIVPFLEEHAWAETTLDRCLASSCDATCRTMLSWPSSPAPIWLARGWKSLDADAADPDDLAAVRGGLPELFAARAAERAARVADMRRHAVVPAWREPTGIPQCLEQRVVERGPSSREGIVAISGRDHVGLFDKRSGRFLFAPPSSVALGMAPDQATLLSWRVEKRQDASGIARGDYDWVVERYSWPGQVLLDAHIVKNRKVIDWCWPLRLDVPVDGNGGIVVLKCRSEDWVDRVFLVCPSGGQWQEAPNLAQALTLLAAS